MSTQLLSKGKAELAGAHRGLSGLLWAVGLFSVLANLLVLTAPLYMLQVYDRVLGSHSEATLLTLTLLAGFLYLVAGILDHARTRILAVYGARLQDRLDARVFDAALRRQMRSPGDPLALSAQHDLEWVQRLWASPVVPGLFDLPWAPVFLVILFAFESSMGWLALGGGLVLAIVAWLNIRSTKAPLSAATGRGMEAARRAEQMKTEAETLLSMGMGGAAFGQWMAARGEALRAGLSAGALGGRYAAIARTFRIALQSAVLGLGALAVLRGHISGGAMIAGSILMGRALQPVEQLIGQWATVSKSHEARRRLVELLATEPAPPPRTPLPQPPARLDVQNITIIPPGEPQPVLRGISFTLQPGQALGVIGASGAGKSSLARAITGVWLPSHGRIRLGGATLDQYAPDDLGRHIGYLPQRVSLFEGTIAQNIARLDPNVDPARIIDAAQRAAAHEMILALPEGYDTRIAGSSSRLSGGQLQRIGLARALYGDPVLLVLDEPNSNLDNDGSLAVNTAIRRHKERGGAVLIIAHRPAAIRECDFLLMIEGGTQRALGATEQVLGRVVSNQAEIMAEPLAGGVS